MSFDWSSHKGGSGVFVKWETVGDSFTGTVVGIREHTFDKEKGPVVLLDLTPRGGGDPVTMSLDKVDLRRKVAELEPQVSDELRVTFTGTEKLPNSPQPMKLFEVLHKAGERKPESTFEPEPQYSDEPF